MPARVKYDCQKRRWVFDCAGVDQATAAKHGYIPRPVAPPPSPRLDPAYARAVRDRAAAATWEAKRAAKAKAAKKVAAMERARLRRRAYFHSWWLRVGKSRRAERREAARALLRNAPGCCSQGYQI
jgi:hypothetical protein